MFEVDRSIVNNTQKCRNDFSCIAGSRDCLCEVEDSFNNRILFIKPSGNNMCDYMMTFGYSYICNCPVRKEIYRLYNA